MLTQYADTAEQVRDEVPSVTIVPVLFAPYLTPLR